jgi:hypothetical protein
MNLNDLFATIGIDPEKVIVMRHRPFEPELNKILPWLAEEQPGVFNAYQQTQGEKLENSMMKLIGDGYVASFIGQESGKALFVGIYKIDGAKPLTHKQYWKVPAYKQMQVYGMRGFQEESRESILWFDLTPTDFYSEWKGKMVIKWPAPERSWWRRAHKNDFQIYAITEESKLSASMPEWYALDLKWDELKVLPSSWREKLSEWRGVYYIFDTQACVGYVGSAYGSLNILGRWLNYAETGHGGNKLLKNKNPEFFRFTILERVSPDMSDHEVIAIENSWKNRLHTIEFGLNDN